MKYPKLMAFLSTNYNNEHARQEVCIDHIQALSKIQIILFRKFTSEELENINFLIEDRYNRFFNQSTLAELFEVNFEESRVFTSYLNNGVEAQPPYTFVFKSDIIDLSNIKFQIGWTN